MSKKVLNTDTMSKIGSSKPARKKVVLLGVLLGVSALTLTACGGNGSNSAAPAASDSPTQVAPKVVHIDLTGKIDTNSGAPGTYTGKEHWPAVAPSDVTVHVGDTVVLTIKEYDDAETALPASSPYNTVAGGTMTVDGVPTTFVSNADIAHTYTITELGINVPLMKAKNGPFSTTVFTFTATKSGTYTWRCFTPCGGDPKGMGGSMATMGWMKGQFTVV